MPRQWSCEMSLQQIYVAALLVLVIGLSGMLASAQTFSVLHSFTGGPDGAHPLAGVTMDGAGNLYGTASLGGFGSGAVFELARRGSGWVVNPLYQFRGMPDGFFPEAGVTIAPDGTLYGTTFYGGNAGYGCAQGGPVQCGTVFQLRPPATACKTALCPWAETQIYEFNNYPSLFWPNFGDLILDRAGNLYGVANQGGSGRTEAGGVFRLAPSDGGWTETNIYEFQGTNDGGQPLGGVTFDSAGNLFGTTFGFGGLGNIPYGSVYELMPAGSGWTESTLYLFQNGQDGAFPKANVIVDALGNLYGTTSYGGLGNGGTVFELAHTQSGWVFNILYSLVGPIGRGSFSPLLMDAAGNLYGTTVGGGAFQQGSVFKLTYSQGGWTYNDLHDFTAGSDGRAPYGALIVDASGNLYGTAGWGGSNGNGVVWEITP